MFKYVLFDDFESMLLHKLKIKPNVLWHQNKAAKILL